MYVISGQIADQYNHPLAGARVYLLNGPVIVDIHAFVTKPDGHFVLNVPCEGVYQIDCIAYGFIPAEVTVTISSDFPPPIHVCLKQKTG